MHTKFQSHTEISEYKIKNKSTWTNKKCMNMSQSRIIYVRYMCVNELTCVYICRGRVHHKLNLINLSHWLFYYWHSVTVYLFLFIFCSDVLYDQFLADECWVVCTELLPVFFFSCKISQQKQLFWFALELFSDTVIFTFRCFNWFSPLFCSFLLKINF